MGRSREILINEQVIFREDNKSGRRPENVIRLNAVELSMYNLEGEKGVVFLSDEAESNGKISSLGKGKIRRNGPADASQVQDSCVLQAGVWHITVDSPHVFCKKISVRTFSVNSIVRSSHLVCK